MWNKCLMLRIKTCLKKSVFDVLDDRQMESWSDTSFEMAFKTSFNTMCLRFPLQKYSPRIFQILWKINKVQVWNSSIVIKRRVLLHRTCFDKKKWPTTALKHTSIEEWTLCIRKGHAFDARIKCSQWSYSSNKDQVKISTCNETMNT